MSLINSLNVDSVNDFFDNIADYEEDFDFMQNNESAFYFAKQKALENNSNSSSIDDDFEDNVNDDQSETTDIDTLN
jgi:hypothetical protein